MDQVITCITGRHDIRLVALAALICLFGMAAAVMMLALARSAEGPARRRFAAAAAVIAGLSVWSTHFVAMLAWRPGVPVAYDVLITVLSLGIAVAGFSVVIYAALRPAGWIERVAVGLGMAATVAIMHWVGMAGVHAQGARLAIDVVPVLGSAAIGAALLLIAGFSRSLPERWRVMTSTGLIVLAIVVLHFGGMTAVSLTVDPLASVRPGDMAGGLLMGMVAGALVIVLGIGGVMSAVALWTKHGAMRDLRDALEAMPDGLGFYDVDDRLVVWNSRYGETNPELAPHLKVGKSFAELLQVGLDQGLYHAAIGREAEWVAERLSARHDADRINEQPMDDGRVLRVRDRRTAHGATVTVVSDITDLKRDAQRLSEARDEAEAANRAKSEFLANMSHEIRTPLNGIIGLAQTLARTELDASQTEMLELIQSSGQTLQTLLSDILDLARVESGRLGISVEPMDLERAVQEAAQLYAAVAADKGLQFFVDVDPDARGWIMGDVVRIKQILTNLVSNAVKFTPQGFVSLTVQRFVDATDRPMLRFTVQDTGVGFDCSDRERVFGRFQQADGTITRRFGGTGLGLAICRQLSDLMGGDLDCESEPDGGSAFILTLPLTEAAAPGAQVEAAVSTVTEGSAAVRVLLADDHPTNRRVVELILAQADVDLTAVEDGAQAVEAYDTGAFDLVLMDMQMPVMDGLTAVREIRRLESARGLHRAPIVMLTANALPEHVAAAQAAGADHHLAKPFNAAELLALAADPGSLIQSRAA